jgi:hypothetical protein
MLSDRWFSGYRISFCYLDSDTVMKCISRYRLVEIYVFKVLRHMICSLA